MGISRHFLGTSRPALAAAASYLIERFAAGSELDLSTAVVVVPGSRAARRLLELLVQLASGRWPGLQPPRILTFSELPELLYPPKKPFADDFTQLLVWRQALFACDQAELHAALPHPPDPEAIGAWTALCTTFRGQHRELAAEDSDFATVAKKLQDDGPAAEASRWKALEKLQKSYHSHMDQLELWDKQTARLEAVKRRECRTDKDIILVATTDISQVVCRMLDQVADRVTALIHADSADAGGFDNYGGLRPEYWEQKHLQLPTAACQIAANPPDQARRAVAAIAARNGRFRADQIAVGAADETLVPVLQQHLRDAGTAGRWPVGRLLRQSPPWRLLAAVASHLASARDNSPPDFDSLSELVRHPDCSRWIQSYLESPAVSREVRRQAHEWLALLDDYLADHLQLTPGNFLGKQPRRDLVMEICRAVDQLVAKLLPDAPSEPAFQQLRSRRSLADWSAGIVKLLQTVYSASDAPQTPAVNACIESLQGLSEQLQKLEKKQTPSRQILPLCSADQAIQLLLKQIADKTLADDTTIDGIDIAGWLDLPLDDSPLLVLTGFNEGAVPQSMAGDAFLPDSLRTRLGLKDNRFRYARDACAMHAILSGGREITVIMGKTNADGDPLSPSRLWFACPPEEIRRRVVAFFSDESAAENSNAESAVSAPSTADLCSSRFTIPSPIARPAPEKIPVTHFREFLQCPYRYFLRREMRLNFVDGNVREISAGSFGELIHTVLKQFGDSALRNSEDPEAIRKLLLDNLQHAAVEAFGSTRSATVNVQLKMIESRLSAFAGWQAATTREGWQIVKTEELMKCPKFSDAKDRPITLEGRIDRIDHNQQTGEWRVLDYKTSEKGDSPKAVHMSKGEWIDLQLPLYRLLARANNIRGPIQLGYIQLPGDLTKVGLDPADWTESELDAAEKLATELAAQILDLRIDTVPVLNDQRWSDLAWICQETVIDRSLPWAGNWSGRDGQG
jgi:RecB family exonuclease